jgi:hypothetical protein
MVTGGYNKSAHVIDINATSNTSIQCNYNEKHGSKAGKLKVYSQQKETTLKSGLVVKKLTSQTNQLDCRKQVTLGCWAPLQK